jgi:dihydrofolate synthase/folylpolyglutamate synthase
VASMAPFLDTIQRTLGSEFEPSFFEMLLLVALRFFSDRKADVVILETGIGGYNDVVSIISGPLACITSVGLDHADELGPTIGRIAADKVGVATDNTILVLGPSIPAEALEVIEADARGRGVELVQACARGESSSLGFRGHMVAWETSAGGVAFHLPLAGDFQLQNLATAACLLHCLSQSGVVADPKSIAGVADTQWKGRLELVPGCPSWILDAAHNALAFESVAAFVASNLTKANSTLLFGASELEKADLGLRLLSPLFERVWFVGGFYRSICSADLSAAPQTSFSTPEDAIEYAAATLRDPHGVVLVTGSVFLAGACRRRLLELNYPLPRQSDGS